MLTQDPMRSDFVERNIREMPLTTANLTDQLTPRKLQLLELVAEFCASRCYSPTIGELAGELGISRSTVFEHIDELRTKTLLCTRPGKARSLKLTCRAQKLLEALDRRRSDWHLEQSGGIPLAGRVAAGAPIEAIENKEALSLKSCFAGTDELFALQVQGSSMLDDGIRDGDYVICRRSRVADNGQLVIAIIEQSEATLKRFYKEKDRVRLEPANADYRPIYSDDCRVEAVVVGLIRKLWVGYKNHSTPEDMPRGAKAQMKYQL